MEAALAVPLLAPQALPPVACMAVARLALSWLSLGLKRLVCMAERLSLV